MSETKKLLAGPAPRPSGLEPDRVLERGMIETRIIAPMTAAEARACLLEIKLSLVDARQKALELYEREGWKALGYASVAACFEAELGYSMQHGYRLLTAAKVEQALRDSPLGESAAAIPERHLRELAKVKDPVQQVEAYRRARQLAQAEGSDVTANHVRRAVGVAEDEAAVFDSPYPVVSHMVSAGDITAKIGREMVEQLEKLPPRKQGYLLQLMAQPGLTCPELIGPIAEMFDRPPGQESLVLPEILEDGTLNGVPLARATMTDLQAAKWRARAEHIERSRPVSEPVSLIVYKGDPKRSISELKRALGDVEFGRLHEMFLKL